MDSKEELRNLIQNIRDATGIGQEKQAIKAGYKAKSLTQILSSGVGVDAAIRRLKVAFQEDLKKSTFPDVDEFDGIRSSIKDPTLMRLIATNELLAKSNAEAITHIGDAINHIGEAVSTNRILVETNAQLANKALSQSVSVAPQTSLTEIPRMKDLLGLIADVASGKRFESRREALTVIHKLMHDKPENASVMDTQKG